MKYDGLIATRVISERTLSVGSVSQVNQMSNKQGICSSSIREMDPGFRAMGFQDFHTRLGHECSGSVVQALDAGNQQAGSQVDSEMLEASAVRLLPGSDR